MFTYGTNRPQIGVRRRGAVAVFALVMMVVLLGFAALTVDVGAMYNTRADLQNAADAAALSGVQMYLSPEMDKVRQATGTPDFSPVSSLIKNQATSMAGKYQLYGSKSTLVQSTDIIGGFLDLTNAKSTINTGVSSKTFNAVSVMLRREKGSTNGALPLTFSGIFGKTSADVSASAVAVFNDHVSGFDPAAPGAADLWPFTIHQDEYNYWLGQSTDAYSYDPDDNSVYKGSDKFNEVRLYPSKLAPGNFGLLNIGSSNQSVNGVADQIDNGVSGNDLKKEIGTSTATFSDDSGNPITHDITGNSGLKASLNGDIQSRIGDVVGIFLHDQVSGNGANTVYRTTGIRFVRVLDVSLQGNNKFLWVEPTTYTGPGVLTNPSAPSSGGNNGVIMLAR